ncbi:amidohydrolase family protein [Candidatus Poseidonia alphae]|nr:amidohydrolase family protein [Candidatus Poseidonia alphae]MDA8838885.1 amidohydrolase family protein [Candidatus Poseidonia alphae]
MRGNMLIRGATMVLPGQTIIGDLRIKTGVIETIDPTGSLIPHEDELLVDAEGLHLLPGMIDPQCHFRDPGQPEKEDLGSGSAAAVSGGVTSFLDMPNNKPSITTMDGMNMKLGTASQKCVNNYGFFIGATPENVADLQEAVGTPDAPIAIPGICGIKVFMGSSTGTLLVNERKALETIFENTAGLIAVHAEDEQRLIERFEEFKSRTDIAAHAEWRDDVTALLATKLAVELAESTGHRLHVLHLTSGLEADWLEGKTTLPSQAESSGAIITTETLPQHLTFDEDDVKREGTRLKMNPPIRYKKDRELLWNHMQKGTIQCIATDHAPHTLEAKDLGFPKAPSGMPGVDTSLAVMLTHAKDGKCSIEDVVRWMSTNVADCYNMSGKGLLEEGNDGDVVLVDMVNEAVVEDKNSWSRVGWSPFRGHALVGWAQVTVVAGVPVFERTTATGQKGKILVEPGEVGEAIIMTPWE